MKTLYIILAVFFLILSAIFSYLPLGTIALIPISFAFLFSYLVFKKSETPNNKFSKILLILTIVCLIFVLVKVFFIKNELEIDTKFEQQKIENNKDAKKDLEDLENDLE
ncbi:MAG: hypothetical protein NWQ31_11180 [Polaribacter sp.]|nr:hypothetical protein [Polaribacter sp.]